jgi:hypothetical protein
MQGQERFRQPEREQPLAEIRPKEQEQERRLVHRILRRWESARGALPFPAREEIDAAAMGDDWPSCFVLDLDGADGPHFVHVGDALEATSWNPPVRTLSTCPDGTILKMATAFLLRIVEKRIPISIGASGQHLGRTVLFRAILLPLSRDRARIDGLLGAANFRETVGDGA